jgi:hypothetical protein
MPFVNDMMRTEFLTIRGEVKVTHVFGGGLKPEEDTMRSVLVSFCWTFYGFTRSNKSAKSPLVINLGLYSCPALIRCLSNGPMMQPVLEI